MTIVDASVFVPVYHAPDVFHAASTAASVSILVKHLSRYMHANQGDERQLFRLNWLEARLS